MALRLIVTRHGKYTLGDIIEPRDAKHILKRYPQVVERVPEPVPPPETVLVPVLPPPEPEPEPVFDEPEEDPFEEEPEPEVYEEEPVYIKPGETVEISGQYVQIAGNYHVMRDRDEATLVEGEPAPPTDRPGWRWRLEDATQHSD